MKFMIPFFLLGGLAIGGWSGWNDPARVRAPHPPLEPHPFRWTVVVDTPPDDPVADFVLTMAPAEEGASLLDRTPQLSTRHHRAVVWTIPELGDYRLLVQKVDGRTLVDRIVSLSREQTVTRVLVPSSTRPPAEAGIVVRASDPDGQPRRVDRVIGWITTPSGRRSRSDFARGSVRPDDSTLVPVGARVHRFLTGADAGTLHLWVESPGLGGAWVEVPTDPDLAPDATVFAEVLARMEIPCLPEVQLTGVPSDTTGRWSIRATPLRGEPTFDLPPIEARCDHRGVANFDPLPPGPVRLDLVLDLLPPLRGTWCVATRVEELSAYDTRLSWECPDLHPLTVVNGPEARATVCRLTRMNDSDEATDVLTFTLRPSASLDLHGVPAGEYRFESDGAVRTVRVPSVSEVVR